MLIRYLVWLSRKIFAINLKIFSFNQKLNVIYKSPTFALSNDHNHTYKRDFDGLLAEQRGNQWPRGSC